MNNPRTYTQPRLLKTAPHSGLRGLRGLQGLFWQKTFWEGCLTVSREYIYTNPRSPHYPRSVTDTNGFRNSLTLAEPPQQYAPNPRTDSAQVRNVVVLGDRRRAVFLLVFGGDRDLVR